MHLYSGTTPDFLRDTTHNAIAQRLSDAFLLHFRYKPSENERRSWHNSLRSLSDVIRLGDLMDQGILVEYQLPLTSRRLDAMITGRDGTRDRAVIVELKQWETSTLGSADDLLTTWVGGDHRDVLHPSVQVNQYRRYLEDTQEVFHADEGRIGLDSCAYLHNYMPIRDDALFARGSEAVRRLAPVFTGDDTARLAAHLSERLGGGEGERVMHRVAASRYKPAKKLLAHVSQVIKEEPAFVLLDEQQVLFSQVMATVESSVVDRHKHVFLVHGGPGTGKSVLALNLLGALSGKGVNAQHATGSKAFTKTLQKIVGRQAATQFRYFNNYVQAGNNDVDVLTGSSALIREYAARHGCVLHESTLEAQFRCAGSDAFVGWIDNTLGVRKTPHALFDQQQETFEFGIVESPEALEALVRAQVADGNSARLVAGYCWPWSKQLAADGQLEKDVRIDGFERAWNARPDMSRLPKGVPKADYWAHDPAGLEQVGCIYTAQGFEFDYVGIIWGKDLRYDPDVGDWVGDRTKSHDTTVKRSKDRFSELVKNTYRVLLSRGMKGCYVYFEDEETEKFIRSRTENLGVVPKAARVDAVPPRNAVAEVIDARPFLHVKAGDVRPWENAVPLLDLKVAAGAFSDAQDLENDAVEWVALPDHLRPMPGQFVAQVVGESMNRRIPNGAWALFTTDIRGSKQGKTVLAQCSELGDPEEGGRYTIKIYDAAKREGDDGAVYDSIMLRPSSTDPSFQPIAIDLHGDDGPTIVAVLIATLV